MRNSKKLVALILSLVLLLGGCIVPVSADVEVTKEVLTEKYKSLFDLSDIPVGTTCTSGIPAGLDKVGIAPFSTNSSHKHGFDGGQTIVENVDGSKSWRLDFTTQYSMGGWLNEFNNEFSVSFAVPTEYAKKIRSIRLDLNYNSTCKLGYLFGVFDGEMASYMKDSGDTFDANFNTGEGENGTKLAFDYRIVNLRKIKKGLLYKSKTTDDTKTYWAEGDSISYIYLTLVSRGCTGTEGGYALINDIGFTYYDTETEVVGTDGETHKYNLFDVSTYDDGEYISLPTNVSSFIPSLSNDFEGDKQIVSDSNGKKGLKLDFSNTVMTFGDSQRSSIIGGEYGEVYGLKLKIPTNHLPLIENINFKYEKHSNNKIIYNFGVTDGTYLSKSGSYGNTVIPAEFTGEAEVEINLDTLNLVDEITAGSKGGSNEKWSENEYTDLFLWITVKPDNSGDKCDGYFVIKELGYSFFATDLEIEKYKGYINGFEGKNGTVTEYASSGTRAFKIFSGTGKTVNTFDLKNNQNVKESTGLSFWIYNPTSTTANFKICLKGRGTVSFVVNDSYTVPSNSKERIDIDFSNVYRDKNYSNATGFTQGTATSLTKSQITSLSAVTLLCREKNLTLYADDFYLDFNGVRTATNLNLSNATGEGLQIVEGKLRFPSSEEGSIITAFIPVNNFEIDCAKDITLNFDSDVKADYYIKLIGTDDNGNAAHWRWGYSKKSGSSITADGTTYVYTHSLAGTDKQYHRDNIHEAEGSECWVCWSDTNSNHNNTSPSSSEKGTVHTVEIRVFNNVGTSEQAVTLSSATVTYAANTVTVGDVENGTVTVDKTTAFSGQLVNITVNPQDGYYLKDLNATREDGVKVESFIKIDGENIGNYYTIEMPRSNLYINPVFAPITETAIFGLEYRGNDTYIEYTLPLQDGKAYNTKTKGYADFKTASFMFVAGGALEKYGFKSEDLTYEKICELTEKGHHIVNYIYRIDLYSEKTDINGFDTKTVAVNIEDVSINARRSDLAIIIHTDFESSSVSDYEKTEYKSIDKHFYGDNLSETFEIERGINYDQVMQGGITNISIEHHRVFKVETWLDIKAHGFDHVRLPVNLNSSTDLKGNINEKHLERLDKVVKTILRSGMRVVIDLHGFKDFNGNFRATRPEFLYVWEQLANRYAHLPLSAAFQLINEPRFQDYSGGVKNPDIITRSEIMSVQEEAIDIIRPVKGNEERYIAISTQINMSNDAEMNSITQKMYDTPNLILDIHYYGPMSFTHSGNDWSSNPYPSGATSWSDESNKNTMAKLAQFEKDHPNFIVWIGEWGAFNPDYNEKMKYYQSITSYAKEYGVAWAIWDFASGWGPYSFSDGWKEDYLTAMGLAEFIK